MLRLETARLVLRDWTPADIPDLIEGLNDLSVSRWLAFVPHPYTREAAERWLAYCTQLSGKGRDRDTYEFAIELKSEQKVIGGISLARVSRLHGTAGGGIWLNARYQGHRYGREAFGEKIRFAFVDLQLRRLDNGFFTGNDSSWAMQQHFGYTIEGERRQAYRCMADGALKDECITGLLKEEWKMSHPPAAADLAQRFDQPSVQAIALLGSHARGDAGPFSDVDLLRLVAAGAPDLPDNGTHLIDGRLVNVGSATPADTAAWFERPEKAVTHIAGLRVARALLDRDGGFAELQAKALAFVWDAAMQERADRWASRQLVGWAEEAHKGLEGLRRGDVGRLLNARHGCSWGLNHVMQVQRGVLVTGDNAVYDEVGTAMADQPKWLRLRRLAFGVEEAAGITPTLAEQVRAGLRLYALTAELLDAALQPEDRPIIVLTVAHIREALQEAE